VSKKKFKNLKSFKNSKKPEIEQFGQS